MKKFIFGLVLVGGIVVGGPILGSKLTEGQVSTQNNDLGQVFDRFNVTIKKEPSYVVTNSKYGTKQEPGGYLYTQKAINESGKSYDLTFYAPGELRENAILKLDTKGRFVETWEEVKKEDVPKNVVDKL
ncbi:YxeA family protein [Vagococcus hydrophili]|uniref:YxeA family protein n=1 Tax=Vagococcus hydrophili TaxID=2714947 RepID=A0A6G8ASA4_9ENTE|nr:YxeA family protein [Vagococcus hydrophili]QIL47870.1 YxeA family protein [Vagococcus hydrophili]